MAEGARDSILEWVEILRPLKMEMKVIRTPRSAEIGPVVKPVIFILEA